MVHMHSALQRRSIPRRAFLAGAGCIFLLPSCSNKQKASSSKETPIEEALFMQSGFADGFTMPSTLVTGKPQRAPFFLYGSNGLPIVNGLPAELTGQLVPPTGSPQTVNLLRYSEGIPTPYFLLEFELTEGNRGICQLKVEINGAEQIVEFRVVGKDETDLIQIGESMRSVDTPTFEDPADFDPLCTRYEPCPFHQTNLSEALENNHPTVLMISTPGFCQTSICGPVLELLIELPRDPNWNVIHAEVYTHPREIAEGKNIQELIAPVVRTYGMDFEPCLIVADSKNTVTARLDYAFDKKEIEGSLGSVI